MEKLLRELANKLPTVFYEVKEREEFTGQDLILCGQEKTSEGIELDPDKIYLMPVPVKIAVNHYRRMRKKWSESGIEGVKMYVAMINKMAADQRES